MTIDLQRFCAVDDIRAYLRAPWHFDGWVYATNGHICVRVRYTGQAGVLDATSKHPKAHDLFAKWLSDGAAFQPMPELPEGHECRHCHGKGLFPAKPCEDCGGQGTFVHCGNEYDCKSCDRHLIEEGWIVVDEDEQAKDWKCCNHCWGRGLQMQRHDLGDATFELAYLLWLAGLPGLEYRTNGPASVAAFRFDGGEAILMPRVS